MRWLLVAAALAGTAHARGPASSRLVVEPRVVLDGSTLTFDVSRTDCATAEAYTTVVPLTEAERTKHFSAAAMALAVGLGLALVGGATMDTEGGPPVLTIGAIFAVGGLALVGYTATADGQAVSTPAREVCEPTPVPRARALLVGAGRGVIAEGLVEDGRVRFDLRGRHAADLGRAWKLHVTPPGGEQLVAEIAVDRDTRDRLVAAVAPPAPAPPAPVRAPAPGTPSRVAVLELRNLAGLTDDEGLYLADVIRRAAVKALPRPKWSVMTRENMLAQLPPGADLAACQGDCEVETGRNIGADLVVSGEVLRYGAELRVTLKLHDTRSATLVGSESAGGPDLKALERAVDGAAREAFSGL